MFCMSDLFENVGQVQGPSIWICLYFKHGVRSIIDTNDMYI